MHPKLTFEQEFYSIVSRKTLLYVSVIHIGLILILYLTVIIQNFFWNTTPQTIAVSLISSVAFQKMSTMTAVASKQIQAQKQKKKTEKTKQNETKPVQEIPTKKTWKPLDIKQITKPTETQVKEFKPVIQTTAANSVQEVSSSALAANLKKSLSSVKLESSGGTIQANSAMLTYFDSVSSFLYEKWEQPSKLAVSGEPPSALVRLKIGANGRLMGYQIIKDSNFTEMNNSIKLMLDTINTLPPPPDGAMTIEVTLILTN